MESNNFIYKYLKFVSFSGLELWDTKRYNSKKVNSSFDLKQLYNCIIEQSTKYKIFEEKETEFKILGVNNKEGIFDAYILKGKNINQPYKKMQTGWIAYNPYRINVGSIGIKLNEHKYEYISPAYVVFSCKENLLPKYLFMIFKTELFNNIIKESTTGSVRQNLTFDSLKKLQIPLPSLEEQNRLVENYAKKIKVAEEQEQEAGQLEHEIENYLLEKLGIQFNYSTEEQDNSKIKLIHFKDVDRWAVDYLKVSSKLFFLFNAKYQPVKLKNIILSYQYGLSQKATKENIGTPILRMNNIFESQLILEDLKYIEYNNNVKKFILNKGDLLFNRTNSKELVGKTAIFEEDSDYTFASYLIRVVINDKIADNKYINYVFNSSILQFQKNMISRQITGQANINAQEMQELLFPLPPLEKQKEIVAYITNLKNKIKKLHILAKKNREEAIQEFEQEIFNS